jgi:geranylgeranyl diphosphate synthase, type II
MSDTSSPSFAEIAKPLVPLIDAALDAHTRLGDDCPGRLREAMRYSLLAPGKRLRPMLTLLAAEACGGTIDAAMPAACAVEMVHAYSLVHDDLPAMDDDDLRRGRPTCHKAFDEATAILGGDALLTLAFEVAAREIQPPAVAAACCAVLAQAAGAWGMVGGQQDDIDGERGRGGEGETRDSRSSAKVPISQSPSLPLSPSPLLDCLTSLHRRKTGALIRASLQMGAITAGASDPQRTALDIYGQRLGLAFQIIDDLLDVQSNEALMGKRVGKDAGRGKLTFPGVLGLDPSARYAQQLILEACDALKPLGEEAQRLVTVARYVLERNR